MKRIYHTWEKWECYPAGFYDERPPSDSLSSLCKDELERMYAEFLSDADRFKASGDLLLSKWPNSCEHYLTNEKMNRIAWIGQACACISLGIPSAFRGGFNLLSNESQKEANEVALGVLNKWLLSRGEAELTMEQAASKTEANIY